MFSEPIIGLGLLQHDDEGALVRSPAAAAADDEHCESIFKREDARLVHDCVLYR